MKIQVSNINYLLGCLWSILLWWESCIITFAFECSEHSKFDIRAISFKIGTKKMLYAWMIKCPSLKVFNTSL